MDEQTEFAELKKAVELLGGFEAAGRVCGVSGKAVQKWLRAGRLPRTEATGETDYARRLAEANSRISRKKLRASVMRAA